MYLCWWHSHPGSGRRDLFTLKLRAGTRGVKEEWERRREQVITPLLGSRTQWEGQWPGTLGTWIQFPAKPGLCVSLDMSLQFSVSWNFFLQNGPNPFQFQCCVALSLCLSIKCPTENYTYTFPKSTNYLHIISKAISPLTIETRGRRRKDKSTKSLNKFDRAGHSKHVIMWHAEEEVRKRTQRG